MLIITFKIYNECIAHKVFSHIINMPLMTKLTLSSIIIPNKAVFSKSNFKFHLEKESLYSF